MQKIEIAKVLKPQGIKGEIKVELYLSNLDFWRSLKKFEIDGKVKNIKSVKYESVNKIDVLSDTILNDKNADKYFELWKAQVKKTLKNKNEDKIQLAEFEYVYPDFY